MHEAGLTVLVVEDEPIIRFTLTDVLEEAGYTVLEASNVLEAVAIIGKVHTISAVVTDIDMPGGLSGIDLVHMLDTCQQHISVIVTSGDMRRIRCTYRQMRGSSASPIISMTSSLLCVPGSLPKRRVLRESACPDQGGGSSAIHKNQNAGISAGVLLFCLTNARYAARRSIRLRPSTV